MVRLGWVLLLAIYIPAYSAELKAGEPAPTFALRTLTGEFFFLRDLCGEELRYSSEYPTVVILDFWATWCSPCLRTIPVIRRVVNSFDTNEVALVLVSEDSLSATSRIPDILGEGIPHEICVLDPYHVVMEKYGLEKIPSTFVISPEGKIHDVSGDDQRDRNVEEWLRNAIERCLNK